MEIDLILAFGAAALLLALMPGPDNIYVLSLSISNGPKQGVFLTSGLVSGVVVHTLLAATGLSIILYSSDLIFSLVKYAGAAYLVYLAYSAYKENPVPISSVEKHEMSFAKLFKQGVLMNVLNPKVSLFFIALLPQFVSPNGWTPFLQMAVLGVIFMIIAFLTFSSIAVISGNLASLVSNKRFWIVTKWIKITVLVVLAVTLALSGK